MALAFNDPKKIDEYLKPKPGANAQVDYEEWEWEDKD